MLLEAVFIRPPYSLACNSQRTIVPIYFDIFYQCHNIRLCGRARSWVRGAMGSFVALLSADHDTYKLPEVGGLLTGSCTTDTIIIYSWPVGIRLRVEVVCSERNRMGLGKLGLPGLTGRLWMGILHLMGYGIPETSWAVGGVSLRSRTRDLNWRLVQLCKFPLRSGSIYVGQV